MSATFTVCLPACCGLGSVSRLRQKVGGLLWRGNEAPCPEVRDQLNAILRGWSNYFCCGSRYLQFRAVDQYVYYRVVDFLRVRGTVHSCKTAIRSGSLVPGRLFGHGVLSTRACPIPILSADGTRLPPVAPLWKRGSDDRPGPRREGTPLFGSGVFVRPPPPVIVR